MDLGMFDPSRNRCQRNHGSGAAAMLITHFRASELLDDDDWTFTTIQSPTEFDLRHVGAEPL